MTPDLEARIRHLGEMLTARGLVCGTAESCTGGMIACTLTSVAGASQWFAGSVVSDSNAVKERTLGVRQETLRTYGAVSEAVVREMATGACASLHVDAAVSVSGVAGPGGGTVEKPVGLVWMGFCVVGATDALAFHFNGDRDSIRRQATHAAIEGLVQRLALY